MGVICMLRIEGLKHCTIVIHRLMVVWRKAVKDGMNVQVVLINIK